MFITLLPVITFVVTVALVIAVAFFASVLIIFSCELFLKAVYPALVVVIFITVAFNVYFSFFFLKAAPFIAIITIA